MNQDGDSLSKASEDIDRDNKSGPIFKVITSKFRGKQLPWYKDSIKPHISCYLRGGIDAFSWNY